jgi:uncharacterized protein YecE (DUF72 family)
VSATIRLGTQGWNYPAWVGPFYPTGTRPADMLPLYGRAFGTVEVDSTFYAAPAEPIVRGWKSRVPDGFLFALKVPQEITHERRLVDTRAPLALFLERARLLEDHLGPLLLQMPPDWAPTRDARAALAAFLPELPGDLRWAIEFRDPRWLDDETLALLTAHAVALSLVEGRWVRQDRVLRLAERPTAPFAYARWMGPDRRIVDYSHVQVSREEVMTAWSSVLQALSGRVREIFGYFNNHFQGHAPESARRMQQRLGQVAVAPAALRDQGDLF